MSDNESESRETVADIIREKREMAAEIRAHLSNVPARREDQLLEADSLDREADRLEAAWKRDEERAVEHATRHAEAVARDNCRDCVHNPSGKNYGGGNAAAMREALVMFVRAYEQTDEMANIEDTARAYELARAALADSTTEKSSAVGNAAAMREALKQALYFLRRHHTGAVYAPDGETLTFCEDVAGVVDSALSAPPRQCDRFADAEAARQAWLDDAENWDEFGSPRLELHEWLFATVAEREGEGDGN